MKMRCTGLIQTYSGWEKSKRWKGRKAHVASLRILTKMTSTKPIEVADQLMTTFST